MSARRENARRLIETRHEKGFTVMQTLITGAYINKEGWDGGINILKDNIYGDQPFVDADVTQPLETSGNDPDDPEQYDF